MRDDLTYIVTQKVTATENVNKSISRERIIGQSEKNLKQQCLLFQLLRCLVCTVSWCTRSVHAVNGRVHGRVRVMDGSRTWPVHGRAHSLYMAVDGHIHGPQARPCVCVPCTRPPMYRIHDQGRVQTVYMAVHGPCTWSVHDRNTTVYDCAPCRRACLRKVYTAVHGRVHDPCMAVYNVRTRPRTAVYIGL